MLNSQKLLHIVIPVSLSILYSCFVVQLLHPSSDALPYLALHFAIFLIYMLKTYAVFHYPPTQPNLITNRPGLNHIFKLKLTQERRAQIQQLLQAGKVSRDSLVQQYIKLQRSFSFCDRCENVQPPRAYHCALCNTCIMGRHFHSRAIGFCIGESNQFSYLHYLIASAILSFYSFVTLLNTYNISTNFDKFEQPTAMLFFNLLTLYFCLFLYFSCNFVTLRSLLKNNKTFEEQNHPILKNLNIFESSKQDQTKYSAIVKGFLNFNSLGEVSSWVSQTSECIEE